ncbi:zinc finger protein 271-like [Varanus komodoensis]|uniref:zinc finger protein 271-like n=1 Tax=Varanus komodoensis TaxID=61221 RepID=UPI001CF78BB9|nr:zinc finger protein 271-like [Varanus komodoensis]XP_044307868.1 zinc finger protein 271-like [Varanus komodoensis]XP_044307869.1 zinc finger protein 271-like [Varanus komodoensis]XP_044307870.1 zinc finger protein 271-like [Varanus komodoensis]XP_044307871.1 zinc finger protein 271-like [Varanus komodoensis]
MDVLPQPRITGIKKQYPCPECGRNFKRNSHLIRHKRLHTGEKPYKCPDCGKSFRQSTDVNTHRRIHTGETPYHCNQCGKSFRYRTGLVKHLRCHEEEKPHSCLDCGKTFGHSLVTGIRQRCLVGEQSYKCPDCVKKCENSNLVVHLTVPVTEEPYGCPDCGKGFGGSFQIIRHRRLHTRFQLPNPTTLCSLDLDVSPLLSDHLDAEEGENPGRFCEACDHIVAKNHGEEETFTPAKSYRTLLGRLQGLSSQSHTAYKERLDFERWQCKRPGLAGGEFPMNERENPPGCERLFCSERRHLCFMCGKRFRFESHLITHERIHTGEKPFQCSTCKKSFRDRSDLSKHQKIHSGEKPYKCLDCGKSFHHQLTFIRHQRLHPRERACEQGNVYLAILPSLHTGTEVTPGGETKPSETLGYNFKQKDPSSLWTLELAEGTKVYLAPT